MENTCDKSSAHLHCALRTEFLAAEATNTSLAVDFRLFIFNHDSISGANITADATADAHTLYKTGLSTENSTYKATKNSFYKALTIT